MKLVLFVNNEVFVPFNKVTHKGCPELLYFVTYRLLLPNVVVERNVLSFDAHTNKGTVVFPGTPNSENPVK